eukprot:GHVS01065533.1.p1 GENE.GHVS01065533.1~~GHVS01065533.1.p1  ORF type:complete len:284 (-),score=18.54 GHVS01065533.1:297-1037(-)
MAVNGSEGTKKINGGDGVTQKRIICSEYDDGQGVLTKAIIDIPENHSIFEAWNGHVHRLGLNCGYSFVFNNKSAAAYVDDNPMIIQFIGRSGPREGDNAQKANNSIMPVQFAATVWRGFFDSKGMSLYEIRIDIPDEALFDWVSESNTYVTMSVEHQWNGTTRMAVMQCYEQHNPIAQMFKKKGPKPGVTKMVVEVNEVGDNIGRGQIIKSRVKVSLFLDESGFKPTWHRKDTNKVTTTFYQYLMG